LRAGLRLRLRLRLPLPDEELDDEPPDDADAAIARTREGQLKGPSDQVAGEKPSFFPGHIVHPLVVCSRSIARLTLGK
jgi:hypothetical protein